MITTAQVFGRPAPRIVTKEMIEVMKPGSVIVDMAVGTGGNVEGSRAEEQCYSKWCNHCRAYLIYQVRSLLMHH